MLVEFASERQWDRGLFYEYAKLLYRPESIYSSPRQTLELQKLYHEESGVPHKIHRGQLSHIDGDWYVWTTERFDREDKRLWAKYVRPDDQERLDDFFLYVQDLSAFWRWILVDTAQNGPNIQVLNHILRRKEIELQGSDNPWQPDIELPYPEFGSLETILEGYYIYPFIIGRGDVYKKIRTCNDSACGRLFIYNRPKQTFCNDECRYHYHNVTKIKTGYLAEHQRNGRKNNPATYLRK